MVMSTLQLPNHRLGSHSTRFASNCIRDFNGDSIGSNYLAEDSSGVDLRLFLKKTGMRDSTVSFLNLRTQKVPSSLSSPCSIAAGRQEREV